MLSEISQRNKYTTWYHLYAEPTIKTKSKTGRVTDLENKWLPEGRWRGGRKKQMREMKQNKLPVAKWMSHRYEMYSMGNIFNNYIISLYGNIP